jgi:hypothetical protein
MGTDGDYSFHRKPLLSKSIKLIKKVVDHFVETTYGVKNPKPCKGGKSVRG